ncbi:MAG: hypothetical protein OEY43_03420 [Gammaproteobacteria bacterium]|nr:hypothetical protein [Gammaproteobacteria bacterium]
MPSFRVPFIFVMGLIFIGISSSYAGVNPFKKTVNYVFEDAYVWYFKDGEVIKSGRVSEGANSLFYHLNINKERLRLRFSQNDPSGELPNTRMLENLVIDDVLIDSQRMARFQWCLDNQEEPGPKLKQYARTPNNTCVNTDGDFIIQLNAETKEQLSTAQYVEFVVEPYGRPIRLVYGMKGFLAAVKELETPEPVVVAKPVAKVVTRPVVHAVKKVEKICQAKPPAAMKSQISNVKYPCSDASKKAAAIKQVENEVEKIRQKQLAEEQKKQEIRAAVKKPVAVTEREQEWETKQQELWLARCKKHWQRGASPCYCEKFMSQAPAGVKNTCN